MSPGDDLGESDRRPLPRERLSGSTTTDSPGVQSPVSARQLAPVAAVSAAITIWLAALGLVTTPFMLHKLGTSAYAIFALMTIVTAYLSNLELGFGHATLRFLSRAHAAGESDAEERVLATSLVVFCGAAAVGALIALVCAPFVVKSFAHFPARLQGEAVDAVRLGSLLLVLTFMSAFGGVSLQALGRFRVLMWLRVVSGTLMSVSAVTAAALFKDVRAVLVGQVGISAVTCIVLFAALARATPLPLRPAFDGPTFRAMRGYAGLVFATGVAYQAMLQGPPTVLAGVARAAELTAFAVPAMVLQQLTVLVTSTSTAFMPFASAESAGDDLSHLSMVFRSHMRLTLMAMGPVAGFLVVFASPLLTAWVGADFASHASDPLKLLAVAGLVLALSAPASDVARGLGRPGWTLAYSGCAALVAIAAALVLADRRGAAGAAASLLIALTVTTVPFVLATADRLLAQSPGRLLKSILRPALAAAVACAMFGLGSFVTSGLIGAAAVGVLVIAVYVVAVYRLVLEDLERETLRAGASPLSPVIRALTRVSPRASGTRAG